jgi:hypothetical protein
VLYKAVWLSKVLLPRLQPPDVCLSLPCVLQSLFSWIASCFPSFIPCQHRLTLTSGASAALLSLPSGSEARCSWWRWRKGR